MKNNFYSDLAKAYIKKIKISQPSPEHYLTKLEFAEIRQRGFQRKDSIKHGAKVKEDAVHGTYIYAIIGKIYYKSEQQPLGNMFEFSYLDKETELKIYSDVTFRKGCRPNACVIVKRINVKEVLFLVRVTRNVFVMDEIILPIDYENFDNTKKCVCNNKDFCLDFRSVE